MHPVPTQLGGVVDYVAREPVLAGLMIVILLFVFGAYLFMRRTVMNMRQGYDESYRDR